MPTARPAWKQRRADSVILFLGSLNEKKYAEWRAHLEAHLRQSEQLVLPGDAHEPADIDIAIVANPPPGALAKYPNLRFVQSVWAGVERMLADPDLPKDVTIARLVDPDLTQAMIEGVVAHVMALHRQSAAYAHEQARGEWTQFSQPLARDRRVGFLGLGELGRACAKALGALGFDVGGWSFRPHNIPDVRCFHGDDGLQALLARTDIVVNLLPLTPQTTDILDRTFFARLPRGASIVNVARGSHLVEVDLIDALDSGQIGHAILDVFRTEPLPKNHPFWQHPKMSVFPHVAAYSAPESAAAIAVAGVCAFRAGTPLTGLVDRARGY